jgi:hypothetical protein
MTALIRSVLPSALLLFVLGGAMADPPRAGLLLLDNHSVLKGEVERVGDHWRVVREGGETIIPVARAVAAFPDLDAAYRFLRDKADPRDVDGRLKLARWCDENGLPAQAAAEAKTAAELAPGRAIVQATYQRLQHKADAPAPTPTAPALLPTAVISAAETAEPVDCGAEALKRFAMKVQPILMNTCAGCHAGPYAGKFRLERVYANGMTGPATQRNLATTVALIDRAHSANSPLLQLATTAHGGATIPPLRDRSVPAFKQLDEWVKLTVRDLPAVPAAPNHPAEVTTTTVTDPSSKTDFGSGVSQKDASTGPKDPFDPAIFNRQHHPNAPKPGP